MSEEKLVVIGGGILGVSTAYYLKLLSPKSHVVLLEKQNEVGTGCSFQNGGILDPWASDPWTTPGTVKSTLTSFWKPAQHMQLSWGAICSPSFWVWGTRFLISTFSGPQIEESMQRLAVRTFQLHLEFMARHQGTLPSYSHKAPLLEVLTKNKDVDSYRKRMIDFNQKHKTSYVMLDRARCLKQEPELMTCDLPIKACLLHEGVVGSNADSHFFTRAIATMAEVQGVEVVKGASVAEFEKNGDTVTAVVLSDGTRVGGDKFIVCAGIDSKALGKKLGWTPPLWAVKGYSYNIDTPRKFRHTLHIHGDQTVILNPLEAGLRHSFFAEFTLPNDFRVDQKNIDLMTERVSTILRSPNLERSSYWTGHRPTTSDDLPIVGKFPRYSNVFINAGHGSRGLILGLGSAELAAQLMLGKDTVLNAREFSAERFWF